MAVIACALANMVSHVRPCRLVIFARPVAKRALRIERFNDSRPVANGATWGIIRHKHKKKKRGRVIKTLRIYLRAFIIDLPLKKNVVTMPAM